MQSHLAVDVANNCFTLPQSTNTVAEYVEPLHSKNFPSLSCLSDFCDCEHEAIPTRFLCLELFSSGTCEFVKFRFTPGVVNIPTRRDPTLLLNAIERRIQRP